ncbi:MAG: AbrB/MazE/SpoVT family DNA-binding domain-containing protein [Acidobacteriota bacterium]
MATGTITSKGRITIPKEIRDQMNLRTGQRVDFQVDPAGHVLLKPRNKDVRMLKGIIRSPRKRPVSVQEMNEAITRGFAGLP